MAIFEDNLYSYLSAQSNITSIVGDRIYPSRFPQDPVLPAVVFSNIGSSPLARQDARPILDIVRLQVDCFAENIRDAKLTANAIRDSLESFVGTMGTQQVRAVFVVVHGVEDFDDVPNDFRVMSEYEIWHTL